MSAPNAELAYRVLDHIDAHPEQWDQSDWFRQTECGTTGCFAGWTVALSGHQIEVSAHGYRSIDGDALLTVRHTAAHDLGIDDLERPCQAHADCGYNEDVSADLFSAANTREALGRLVVEIFGPRPAVTA